jgi:hypothetical protein
VEHQRQPALADWRASGLCGDSTNAEDVVRLMGSERAVLFAADPPIFF